MQRSAMECVNWLARRHRSDSPHLFNLVVGQHQELEVGEEIQVLYDSDAILGKGMTPP